MTTYFAVINNTNYVTEVITGVDDATIEGIPTAEWYSNFIGKTCIQTFMDNPEKTYAGIGYTYDPITNNFVAPSTSEGVVP